MKKLRAGKRRLPAYGITFSAIGQDSHRFEPEGSSKTLVLGGVTVEGCPGLAGNSDADVVLHAITNAVSGIHGMPVLGTVSDEMCFKKGIRDSREYLLHSLHMLGTYRIVNISVSIEAQRPRLAGSITSMRRSIARICSVPEGRVALTVTSGEGLTAFGRGEGIQAFAIVTAQGPAG